MTQTIRRFSPLAFALFASCGLSSACGGSTNPAGAPTAASTTSTVTVSPTNIAFTQVGATVVLEVTGATNCAGGVIFVSSNLDLATVSNSTSGLTETVVTASGPGSTTIQVRCIALTTLAVSAEVDVPVTVTVANAPTA